MRSSDSLVVALSVPRLSDQVCSRGGRPLELGSKVGHEHAAGAAAKGTFATSRRLGDVKSLKVREIDLQGRSCAASRTRCKPSRATHKSGRASAQAVWLRRRRSSINEPIASPPSATTGMTKRALRIVPPHCRSDGKSTTAGNLNHLSRPDGSCPAGWRAAGRR